MARARPFPPLLALLLAIAPAACGHGRSVAEERAARARSGRGSLTVAVVWPWRAHPELRYAQGLQLALEEIDASGGVHGRQLRLRMEDDGESVNQGRLVAQRLAGDPDIVAVIGHLQSYVTVPAAAIYDLAGLVLVAPAATDPVLTTRGYTRVFRAIFTDRETGTQMADLAASRGLRRIAIDYVRTDYGRALANAFEERAAERGLSVVARQSYDPGESGGPASFTSTLREWKDVDFDGVFLAGEVPSAGQLVASLRAAGITVPILGGDAMSSPALISVGGRATEGTIVAASFHPDEPGARARRFTAAFRRRFGKDPDAASALGYDALHLLAQAMRVAPTPAPDDVARALHGLRDWPGVTGSFTFDPQGNLVGRKVVELVVRDGRFHYLPAVTLASAGAAPRSLGVLP